MEGDREEQLRQRAYAIWEREGQPKGEHERHWAEAEREIEADAGEIEGDDIPNQRALREAAREHADTYLVSTDLEDDDQRSASPGTREQP